MIESWRWYGAYDNIQLDEIAQTGATGIVTALHEVPYGEVWTREAVASRRKQIENAGFIWVMAESLPVHERVKRGDGDLSTIFANYRQSLANLAAEGINAVCYNFMPLLDWTRTDLDAPVQSGGTCLRFDAARMAAFEIYMLERHEAVDDYRAEVLRRAAAWYDSSTETSRASLLNSIMSGLPGAFDRYDIAGLREALKFYDDLATGELRANYKRFLDEVIPTAEELGIRLCVHPDDPPRNILGLPRIVSNAGDIAWIMSAVDSGSNGLTLCAGSLGADPVNDVPAIARQFADRIHFVHLRNVVTEPDGSFEEAQHLAGDINMVELVAVILEEESRRRIARHQDARIIMRPDHGHVLLSDAERGNPPGYPLIGRLRGLAELRGVICALQSKDHMSGQ